MSTDRAKRKTVTCAACKTTGPHRGKGYCNACYARWDYWGRPEGGPPPPGANPPRRKRTGPKPVPEKCKHGHLWADNLRYDSRGARRCAACRQGRYKKLDERRVAERLAARAEPSPVDAEQRRRQTLERQRRWAAKSRAQYPMGTCTACERYRPIRRQKEGWCESCTRRWYRDGQPESGPPKLDFEANREARRRAALELAEIRRQYREIDAAIRAGGWGWIADRPMKTTKTSSRRSTKTLAGVS